MNVKSCSIIMCIIAAFLASMRILVAPAALLWEMVGFEAISGLSNNALHCLLPAITGGMLLFVIAGNLKFWFSNLLCLGTVGLYAMNHVIIAPLVTSVINSEPYVMGLSAFWSYFLEAGMNYVFPVYFVMLLFYGVSCKKHVVSVVAVIWGLGHGLLLPLLPLLYEVLRNFGIVNVGSQMNRDFLRGLLAILAVVVLIILTVKDIKGPKV